jgi:fucose permease
MLSDHHGANRAAALAEANVGASLGGTAAVLVLGLAQQGGLGWRAALVLALAIPAAAAWRSYAVPLGARPQPGTTPRPAGRLPRLFWAYWGIILLLGAAEWCLTYWGAEYLHNPIGFDRGVAAALMSAFLVAMIVGRVVGSRLVRARTSSGLLARCIALALGGFLLFWLAPWAPLAVGGLALTGLGVANLYPLSLAAAVATAPDNVDAASARVALSSGIALFVAPLTVGGLADQVGIRTAYGIVPALLGVALLGTLLTHRGGT